MYGEAGLGNFSTEKVETLLAFHKKTKSMVDGDPMPHLACPQVSPVVVAGPVADVFSAVNGDHGKCIAQLQTLGAFLPQSLELVRAFRTGRVMTIILVG